MEDSGLVLGVRLDRCKDLGFLLRGSIAGAVKRRVQGDHEVDFNNSTTGVCMISRRSHNGL